MSSISNPPAAGCTSALGPCRRASSLAHHEDGNDGQARRRRPDTGPPRRVVARTPTPMPSEDRHLDDQIGDAVVGVPEGRRLARHAGELTIRVIEDGGQDVATAPRSPAGDRSPGDWRPRAPRRAQASSGDSGAPTYRAAVTRASVRNGCPMVSSPRPRPPRRRPFRPHTPCPRARRRRGTGSGLGSGRASGSRALRRWLAGWPVAALPVCGAHEVVAPRDAGEADRPPRDARFNTRIEPAFTRVTWSAKAGGAARRDTSNDRAVVDVVLPRSPRDLRAPLQGSRGRRPRDGERAQVQGDPAVGCRDSRISRRALVGGLLLCLSLALGGVAWGSSCCAWGRAARAATRTCVALRCGSARARRLQVAALGLAPGRARGPSGRSRWRSSARCRSARAGPRTLRAGARRRHALGRARAPLGRWRRDRRRGARGRERRMARARRGTPRVPRPAHGAHRAAPAGGRGVGGG